MAKIFQKGPAMRQAEHSKTNFEVKNTLRLLAAVFAKKGWACVIEVNSEQDENIRDLESLQNKKTRAVSTKKANRNDPCPCGSGRKYKKCCGA